jgi:hypothetical protein
LPWRAIMIRCAWGSPRRLRLRGTHGSRPERVVLDE